MASFTFKKQVSGNANRQYGVEEDRLGKNLGRKRQHTAEEMTTLEQGEPRNWPVGTDTRAPRLPAERT